MSDTDTKYSEAIRYLDDNFAYFLTDILNIGKPRIVNIPTAAVAIEKGKSDKTFTFLFGGDFIKHNDTQTNAFVLAHETMHILLNHLKLFQSDKFPDKQRANIAADCVINDYLTTSLGFSRPDGTFSNGQPLELCWGEDKVGFNCANSTVREVYDQLPETPPCDGSCKPGDGDGSGHQCDGSCGKGENPAGEGQFDDHDWMHDATQAEQDAAEEASEGSGMPDSLKRTKDDDDYQSALPPGSGVGGKEQFTEDNKVSLKWADLLEEVNPFTFKHGPRPRAAWHRQPRKLAGIQSARLPVHEQGKDGYSPYHRPAIVMALDTSGSIGEEQANQFVNMARSVPDTKIKLFVCTFTTEYRELDLDEPEWNSGGTHFDCISSYIDDVVKPQNKKQYPTAVIVVTDGDANFANQKPEGAEAKAWWWLMTRDGRKDLWQDENPPGQCRNLSDYAVGA